MPEPDSRHVVTLEVNGTRKTVAVEARKLLVYLIREDLGLTILANLNAPAVSASVPILFSNANGRIERRGCRGPGGRRGIC